MKRFLALLLALLCLFALTACSEYTVPFRGYLLDEADLSEETLEWLDWFNSLSEEEQLAVDSHPVDITDALNHGYYKAR